MPSTVAWERPGAARSSSASSRDFPRPSRPKLVVALPSQPPSTFGLKLRVPGWLAGPMVVAVNGEPIDATVDSHGWATVRREWRDGDRVEVRLPMKFAVRPLDDSAPFPAVIMRGPVAMAVRSNGANAGDLLRESDLERSLVPSEGEPLTYRPRSGADLLVRPFYAFKQGERYSLYLDPNRHSHRDARFSGGGWRESEAFRYDDRPGDSAAFEFHGTGIRWIGFRFDDAGIAEVRIDDRPVAQVDQYAPRRGEPFEWRKDGLPAGDHRLTITIAETKPAASKGRFINIAGFEVMPHDDGVRVRAWENVRMSARGPDLSFRPSHADEAGPVQSSILGHMPEVERVGHVVDEDLVVLRLRAWALAASRRTACPISRRDIGRRARRRPRAPRRLGGADLDRSDIPMCVYTMNIA